MVEKTVELKNGNTKRIVADNDADLKDAVKAAQAEVESVPFDINVPVKKGHDLLRTDEALVTETVDGTGAHNSPNNAVREDGSIEGSDPLVVRPSGATTETETKELVSDSNLKDVTGEDTPADDTEAKA